MDLHGLIRLEWLNLSIESQSNRPNLSNSWADRDVLTIEGVGDILLHGTQRREAEPCVICDREFQVIRDAHPPWHAYCLECIAQVSACPECRHPLPMPYRPERTGDLGLRPDAAEGFDDDEMPALIRWDPRAEVLSAIALDPSLLAGPYARYGANRGFLLEAFAQNNLILQYADPNLFDDEEFMSAAVQIDPAAFTLASERLQSSAQFISATLAMKPSILLFSAELQDNEEIILDVVARRPDVFHFISERLYNDLEFSRRALQANPAVATYLNPAFRPSAT